ncbi:hypothetical protein [uncultured Flavobacterium sp.]|uniref:hypothetical protein n=1 Tax=uncultured Flavobacterium sp. TaxID=165435 RepID=UPI00292E6C3E|nr:hypothetical protein [uncultured Flavobacterium sp.]
MNKIFIVLIFSVLSYGQVKTLDLKFPQKREIPQNFKNAIVLQIDELKRLFPDQVDSIKNYSVETILNNIDNTKEFADLWKAEFWIAFHYHEIIPQLIYRVTNKKEIGLVNSADLIILDRIENGDLRSYGHGFIVDDDLFTIAGRANRLLTIISGEKMGSVSMKSTPEDLAKLQKKWIDWLIKL